MTITLNHMVLPVASNERAAQSFAEIMGLTFGGFDGIDGKFATVSINDSLTLFFMTMERVVPQHLAFAVDGQTFDQILARLERAGIPYGNSPNHPDNGRTDHPFTARGFFWLDADRHLFEITAEASSATTISP